MQIVARYIAWIMVASGLLTCTSALGIFAPDALTQSMFGATLGGPGAEIVARNWAVLITLAGGMLIYGAFAPAVRRFALVVVTISKCAFIALIVIYGAGLGPQLWVSAATDTLFVILFVAYLLRRPLGPAPNPR